MGPAKAQQKNKLGPAKAKHNIIKKIIDTSAYPLNGTFIILENLYFTPNSEYRVEKFGLNMIEFQMILLYLLSAADGSVELYTDEDLYADTETMGWLITISNY